MDKLIRFFSSLKLAVILLIGFVILLSIATFYESYTSTEAAQQLIYQRFWFDALLFLLALNVIGSAMIRYPWKKQQIGFVITHIGILVILLGSVVTRKYGIEGQVVLQEGEQTESVSVESPILSFKVPDKNIQVDYQPRFVNESIPQGKELKYVVGNSGITCYVDRYFQNPQMVENVDNEGKEDNPGILINLLSPTSASHYTHWLVANDPERCNLELMVGVITYHSAQIDSVSAPAAIGNQLDIYPAKDRQLTFKLRSAGGKIKSGTLALGEELDTGWKGILLRVEKVFDKARLTEKIVEGSGEDAGSHNSPMIHLRLEKNNEKTESHVIYNTPKVLAIGNEQCLVHFGQQLIPMGFTLQLLDFRAPRYPGTDRPSSFESDVKMIDPVKQIELKQKIYMNNPLYCNGYIVFQSSYIEGKNGQPDISIFSVSKSPGTPIIYAGSIVMILGMIIVVILKART